MLSVEQKLKKIEQMITELKNKKEKLIVQRNAMEEQLRANPEVFHEDGIKMDMFGGILYQITKCDKDLEKLQEAQNKLLAKINKNKR